jgi:ABC-type nitrate/sulfonate/bicarbonate transport system substrate-binding protein
LGVPDAPFSVLAARLDYLTSHPKNIKAFLDAYRKAIDILMIEDSAWNEPAKMTKICDPGLVAQLRDQSRPMFADSLRAWSLGSAG